MKFTMRLLALAFVCLRLNASAAEPTSTSAATNAAFARHLAQLRQKLPQGFTLAVQPPFVVLGDEPPEKVQWRAVHTVKWAVDKLKQDYFQRDPDEIIDIWLFQDSAKTLRQFLRFMARRKARFITIQLALEWSQQSQGVQRATWARKLSMVHQFARWMSVIDPNHQVPPRRLLEVRHRRGKPHIYSDEEIVRLMAEAALLRSSNGMRALTLETLIGLLAATGLRPGEAAALENRDVDLQTDLLVIRESKFGKSRQVPIHSSTAAALKRYARERDRVFGHPDSSRFLVSDRGTALDLGSVRRWFCNISRACGLRSKASGHRCGRGPRLQDLRHTFATRRLVEWYKAGRNVAVQMPKLATYLGHSSVECTYWYIEAVPELLELATEFQLASNERRRA